MSTDAVAPGVAALYIRVSTGMQRENWSVQDQRDLARLGSERGMEVVTYDEQGVSGETLAKRPVMQRLLNDIEEDRPVGKGGGRIRAVIAVDWSRLSRDEDGIDGLVIKQQLKHHNVFLLTPGRVYDFSSESDGDMAYIENFFASKQKQKMVKATTRGWYRKARQECGHPDPKKPCGFMGGVAPFGYRTVADIPHKDHFLTRLEIDEDEASIVRRIFSLYAEGQTLEDGSWRPVTIRGVAEILNAAGLTVTTRYPKRHVNGEEIVTPPERPWRADDVRRILECQTYLGLLIQGKSRLSKWVRDDGPAEVFHPHLRIVDVALWQRAQDVRKERALGPRRNACSPRALAGLMRCPSCGGPMVSDGNNTWYRGKRRLHRRYTCLTYRQSGRSRCTGYTIGETIARRALEDLLIQNLEALRLNRFLDRAAREDSERANGEAIQNAQAELLVTEQKMERLVRAVADGAFSSSQARKLNLELLDQKQRLERRLASLRASLRVRDNLLEAIAYVERNLEPLVRGLDDGRFRQLARMVFARTVVTREGRGSRWTAQVREHQLTEEFREELINPLAAGPRADRSPMEPRPGTLKGVVDLLAATGAAVNAAGA